MKKYSFIILSALLFSSCNQNPNQQPQQRAIAPGEINWEGPVDKMFWRGPGYYNGRYIESDGEFNQWRENQMRRLQPNY